MKYTLEEVEKKVKKYKKKRDDFKVNPHMSNVDNLQGNIKSALKNTCKKFKIQYQEESFDAVLEHLECAMLASPNWFNINGLNYRKIRDFLEITYMTEKVFMEKFDLKDCEKGDKNSRKFSIKEIVAIGQAGRFQQDVSKRDWLYLKSLRMGSINIEDNSDAYKENLIDIKATCSKPLLKKYSNGYKSNALLIALHYHDYIQSKEYSPLLEKFELILIVP